jgi:lysophospholipase L1-like esterase
MNGYVFTVQATATAFAASVVAALGEPTNGVRRPGGRHGLLCRARTIQYGEVKQHTTLSQWMFPSDAVVIGSGVAPLPPTGSTLQSIVPSDWVSVNPAAYTAVVMPMGDSITEGAIGGTVGWRPILWHDVTTVVNPTSYTLVGSLAAGPATVDGNSWPRNHEGHQGYVVTDLNAIAAARITTYAPDIVLLMIGANDANGNVDLPNYSSRVSTLLGNIYGSKADAFVLLSTVLPFGNANANVPLINAQLPALVTAQRAMGRQIQLVDNYATFVANPSYAAQWLSDNIHPNDTGYAVLGNAWYSAVQTLENG